VGCNDCAGFFARNRRSRQISAFSRIEVLGTIPPGFFQRGGRNSKLPRTNLYGGPYRTGLDGSDAQRETFDSMIAITLAEMFPGGIKPFETRWYRTTIR